MLEQKATDSKLNEDGSPKVAEDAKIMASKVVAFIREQGVKAA
jgi:hypothetical protein